MALLNSSLAAWVNYSFNKDKHRFDNVLIFIDRFRGLLTFEVVYSYAPRVD
ncbi:uncharacterized protein RSE6_04452 [Rhynchosporium secalis]|uniref:Uncharacterized protein n=1 Tax=Rhynchosporium secalis TaxID=38038 RepID=A0A1E1M5B9_RHYSE|nr:uncharacterized protein RSE6_04452 [Rhynchosporium secalis]